MSVNWDQPQPAPRALWALVHANLPQARSLGIFNRRNVAGTNTPSAHAEGRALDIGLLVTRPDEKLIGDELFRLYIREAIELGLDHVIWNRRIWSSTKGGPRHYGGGNPHTDHIHVAFTREGSQRSHFHRVGLGIAILRSGLEELSRSRADIV